MRAIKKFIKWEARFLGLCAVLLFAGGLLQGRAWAESPDCPGADVPPTVVLPADLERVVSLLDRLRDEEGRQFWKTTPEIRASLEEIFRSVPLKTKLEQFFQLLFLLQNHIPRELFPVVVRPPVITKILLAARVFTEPSFPRKITAVELRSDSPSRSPLYQVQFADSEVRFPLNEGRGFSSWDQGMCQVVKDLVFYPGFSFRLRKARNSKNLIADDFRKVEMYGQFGTRKIVSIDLNYVDLEKVEFIRGTDEGKVQVRVAAREFRENPHSQFFKFIGTLIPNTSRQRIDW